MPLEEQENIPNITRLDLICLCNADSALDEAIQIVLPHLKTNLTPENLATLKKSMRNIQSGHRRKYTNCRRNRNSFIRKHASYLSLPVRVPIRLLRDVEEVDEPEPEPVEKEVDVTCANCRKEFKPSAMKDGESSQAHILQAFRVVFEGLLKINENTNISDDDLAELLPELCSNCEMLLGSLHKLYVDFLELTDTTSPIKLLLGKSIVWEVSRNKPHGSMITRRRLWTLPIHKSLAVDQPRTIKTPVSSKKLRHYQTTKASRRLERKLLRIKKSEEAELGEVGATRFRKRPSKPVIPCEDVDEILNDDHDNVMDDEDEDWNPEDAKIDFSSEAVEAEGDSMDRCLQPTDDFSNLTRIPKSRKSLDEHPPRTSPRLQSNSGSDDEDEYDIPLEYYKYIQVPVEENPNLNCPHCDKICTEKISYQKHVRWHSAPEIPCPHSNCEEKFKGIDLLKCHIRNMHYDKKNLNEVRSKKLKLEETEHVKLAEVETTRFRSKASKPSDSCEQAADSEEPGDEDQDNVVDDEDWNPEDELEDDPNEIKGSESPMPPPRRSLRQRRKRKLQSDTSSDDDGEYEIPQEYYKYRQIPVEENPNLNCPHCDKICTRRTTYQRHVRWHSAPQIPCPYCEEKVKGINLLKCHIRNIHYDSKTDFNEARPFVCPFKPCPTAYRGMGKQNLKAHIRDMHFEQRNRFSCEICHQKYSEQSYLDRHTFMKHSSHPCHLCNKVFDEKHKLTSHLKSVHVPLDESQFLQCEVCKKKFKSRERLAVHMKSHEPNRPYDKLCEHCGKGFRSKSKLVLHVKVKHLGIKDKICPHCGMAFGESYILKTHILAKHESTESYPCTLCDKVFKLKSYLQQHMTSKVHGGPGLFRSRKRIRMSTKPVIEDEAGVEEKIYLNGDGSHGDEVEDIEPAEPGVPALVSLLSEPIQLPHHLTEPVYEVVVSDMNQFWNFQGQNQQF